MSEYDTIVKAFENPKYNWRTVTGVAREAGVDSKLVVEYIRLNPDMIVQSSINSTSGDELFSLREQRRVKGSTFDRFVSAVKNRGA